MKMATDYSQILTKDEDTRRAYPDFYSEQLIGLY